MKRTNNYSKKKIRNIAVLCGTIAVALLGVFAPGRILAIQSESALDEVTAVPEQYYSAFSSSLARNASANLGIHEKIQLITGQWESETMDAAVYEMELEDYEAVAKARDGIKALYDMGLYPYSISTDYGDWYSWQAQPCKALDTTFHTYAAYYWKIEFERYDGETRHTVYLLEDGTVFLAESCAQESYSIDEISDVGETLARQEDLTAVVQNHANRSLTAMLPYFEGDLTGLRWKSLTQITSGEETCLAMQAYSDNRYLFAVTITGNF